MFVLGILCFALALVALLYVLELVGVSDRGVRSRLKNSAKQAADDNAPRRRLTSGDASLGLRRLVSPSFLIVKNERNLVLAGRPSGWTIPSILLAKILLTGGAVFFASLILASGVGPKIQLSTIVLVAIAYALPDVLLHGKATDRQAQIELELPDTLDQATIAIESGLSFEAALARVGKTGKGPLAEEIVRTVQDMRLGMSRRNAYQSLADRTSSKDLHRFTRSIVQAEEFGVPVADVVRSLAKEMRVKRRFKAEAKALQIPVKMLFPLIVCIFPVLFIVVLFPGFAGLGATLSGG